MQLRYPRNDAIARARGCWGRGDEVTARILAEDVLVVESVTSKKEHEVKRCIIDELDLIPPSHKARLMYKMSL
jgi:hypothetical protein